MIPTPVPLILSPTPLHRLNRMSERLGLDLWIKRDDLTGFALGGNKGRKLEYLMAEALSQGAEIVVTCGSSQSNFIRQLGAACSRFGLRCAAAVMDLPYEDVRPNGPKLCGSGGNEFLDRILGVELHGFPDEPWQTLYDHAEGLALDLESRGHRVYRVPIGGSSALGAYSFVRAAEEVREQADPFDWIVTASSSGSTQTGLTCAFHKSQTRVLGVACDPEPEIVEDFVELAGQLDSLTNTHKGLTAQDFTMEFGFVGPGYGVPSAAGQQALELLARTEGIFLDPIYSAKAFAALMHFAAQKQFHGGAVSSRVLFWHTGGIPSLFALENHLHDRK